MESIHRKHPYGEAVSIFDFNNEDGKVMVNKEALENLFLREEVKSRKIVVLSIIGAFRKGKSFFLDYVLRYMYANVRVNNHVSSSVFLKTVLKFCFPLFSIRRSKVRR